jgi:hypothetical protein
MKHLLILCILTSSFCLSSLHAGRHIQDRDLWKHVVTLDRIVWQERNVSKNISKTVDDENFVRRVYLDITGKIPTYDQMLAYRKSKDVSKRQKLIENLLSSPGYVKHFSVFWQDLLRNPYKDPEDFNHREFTRYIERFLHNNKPYDKIVYDLVMAEGKVQENPAIAFYARDSETGPSDTFNATTRAFLGTRLGCAQCHNHRFDKWTQKEFYEASAHLHGVKYGADFGRTDEIVGGRHLKALPNSDGFIGKLGPYESRIFRPSMRTISFDPKSKLTFPKDYVYDNAKPGGVVKPRIVWDYGNSNVNGKSPRETFALWMTSKENPMFARVMPNRLWKRIMGVANMAPVDDYKDSVIIQNKQLFEALGSIFVAVNYDFKALLSVIFNSEAYQYAFDLKNTFKQENYKVQGALLKRMSAHQINDSLLTLQHGDLDRFAKLNSQYFEFEDRINELALEFKKDIKPLNKAYAKKYGNIRETKEIDPDIIELMQEYHAKYLELKEYYQIQDNGYLKNHQADSLVALTDSRSNDSKAMMTMEAKGSGLQDPINNRVQRANYGSNDFMMVFGALDRSSPDTDAETGATMKQILKMMNSSSCAAVAKRNSYLMKNTLEKESLPQRISYLYYSIYGRSPTKADVKLASNFLGEEPKENRWEKYVLALLNSPEFYFIK